MERWSAPKKMTLFILICMIVVFSFESLGLTNKEGNLEIRKASVILVQTEGKEINHSPHSDIPTQNLAEKLTSITQKTREEKKEKMFQMLIEGAHNPDPNQEHNYRDTIDSYYDI
jgi:hypothetical protein